MAMTARTEAIYRTLFSRVLETSDDSGTTTDGSTTTLEDTAKHWLTDWSGAIAHIFRGGIEYEIDIASNTTTELTFVQTLPFAVTAGLDYSLRRRLTLTDISDRSSRLLGVVDSLTKWGGTALTGRDISSDLAKLDVALSTIASKALLTPLEVASQHGVAETANIDILPSDITPTNTPCLFRIMVMLETAGVFSAILKSGAVSKTLKLNAGNSLLADCAYEFDILVHNGDTVNFQTSVSGNVTLRCQEIAGGVQ